MRTTTLLFICSIFVCIFSRIDAAQFPVPVRQWIPVPPHDGYANRSQDITKVQVEDLDETSSGCVRLRELNFCQDRQPTTRFPNALGHTSEADVKVFLKDVLPLLNHPSCRRSLTPFLCVALTPTCSNTGDGDSPASLPPCRALCSKAKDGCVGALRVRRVPWPSQWKCDQFPEDGLCLEEVTVHHDEEPGFGHRVLSSSSDWTHGHFIQSRGSLEPPPSSTVDEELLDAQKNEPARRISARRPLPELEPGDPRLFRGWVDVQGIGKTNDYCRVLGKSARDRYLSCALNGTESGRPYYSKQGFDSGHAKTWYMKDMDGDGRDDYCRCVGSDQVSQTICMKAGKNGFYGGLMEPGSEYTFLVAEFQGPGNTIPCRRFPHSGTRTKTRLPIKRTL